MQLPFRPTHAICLLSEVCVDATTKSAFCAHSDINSCFVFYHNFGT